MGIKGIYGEIGSGERVALAKLANDKFEQTGRPLRIAIDVSIWQFQIQSGRGGTNPAVRTLYYRLLRLLSLSIQPLFVFDGPNKPPFKRNKRTASNTACLPNYMTKQVLKLFGFPMHNAPGEAEAECALLQREGIVDAVLSEDVDTLMFGCGMTLRNWSSEESRSKVPTHVSVYKATVTKASKAGLDREGMILIALMSGGDYITEGIPGCGIKVACEAARAGYGKSLCILSRTDTAALKSWREELAHQLATNENRYFRTKHKALTIPETFPDSDVLGYYTNPVVSSGSKIAKLKADTSWDEKVNVPALRLFVAEAFDWTHKSGAIKFIRGLAPALLVSKLRTRGDRRDSGFGDVIYTEISEMQLVRAICGKRVHFSTGGITELRLIYRPLDIVGLDLDSEPDDTEDFGVEGLATNEYTGSIVKPIVDKSSAEDATGARSKGSMKPVLSAYDPDELDKIWVSETMAKVGIPLKVEDWEESLRNPRKAVKAKVAAQKAALKGGMPKGALDRYVTIGKTGLDSRNSCLSEAPSESLSHRSLSHVSRPPIEDVSPRAQSVGTLRGSESQRQSTHTRQSYQPSIITTKQVKKTASTRRPIDKEGVTEMFKPVKNPWTLAHPSSLRTVRISKANSEIQPKSASQPTVESPEQPMKGTRNRCYSPFLSNSENHEFSASPSLPVLSNLDFQPPKSSSEGMSSPSPRKRRSPYSESESIEDKLEADSDLRDQPLATMTPSPRKANRKLTFEYFAEDKLARDVPALPGLTLPAVNDIVSSLTKMKSYRASAKEKLLGEQKKNVVIELSSSSPLAPQVSPILTARNGNTSFTEDDSTIFERSEREGNDKKKLFMVRESLEGSWKEVSEDDPAVLRGKGEGRIWRKSEVEILDLTGD